MEQEEIILDNVKLEIEYCGEDIKLEEQSSHSEEQDEQGPASVKKEESDDDINIKLEEQSSHSDEQGLASVKEEEARECGTEPERRQVARYFCCVAGCAGVGERAVPPHQRLFMFSLPTEAERRLQWLRLIDREDLLHSRITHHVCEEHFYCTSVVGSGAGKQLQQNAIPILNLPSGPPVPGAGSPAWRGLKHAWSQACPRVNTQAAQTTVDLQRHVPLVKALKEEIAFLQKEKRRDCSATKELRLLGELCDKHMGRRFAELARLHLRNRQLSSGNRYSEAYKRYCLRLYEASPRVFEQLRELRVLPLPKSKARAAAAAAAAAAQPSGEDERQDTPVASADEETRSDGSASSDSEQEAPASEEMSDLEYHTEAL